MVGSWRSAITRILSLIRVVSRIPTTHPPLVLSLIRVVSRIPSTPPPLLGPLFGSLFLISAFNFLLFNPCVASILA